MSDTTTTTGLPAGLAADLAQVRAPAASSPTLPPGVYADEGVYDIERESIFRAGWMGLGRGDRWANPGDYSALELAGLPTIVIRGENHELAAFSNTCSHRSSQILVGDGSCRHIRCPFHFWTYGLDGHLMGAPKMTKTPDFDKADHALTAFHVAEREGFAFISFDEEPPDIDDWLGDFSLVHAPWSLGDLRTSRRREFEVACNWKSFTEVFNEYYHIPYVHPSSIDGIYDHPDDPDVVIGHFATQFGTTTGTGGLLEDTQDDTLPPIPGLEGRPLTGTRYTWLFPNITFAAGSEAMWMYEVYPISPDRTAVAQTVCFPPSTIERQDFAEKAELYYERFDVALDEDVPILEQQQKGFGSRFAKQGKFSYLEPSVASFACWYAARLGG